MLQTTTLFRFAKIVATGSIALMGALIVLGNCTDYYTNYHFVEHVLKMDTVFANSHVHYRQVSNPFLYNLFYISIILAEAAMTFFCTAGSIQMAKHLKATTAIFYAAKKWAVAGIIMGLLIWFLGFEVIGGEWFSMWQSSTWNGLGAAERVTGFLMLTLILLHMKEDGLAEKASN